MYPPCSSAEISYMLNDVEIAEERSSDASWMDHLRRDDVFLGAMIIEEMISRNLREADLRRSADLAQIYLATGETDDDTIRDLESGKTGFGYKKREPYLYKIERNLDSLDYRRLMIPQVLDNVPFAESTQWRAEFDSDDDGAHQQPSFVDDINKRTGRSGWKTEEQDPSVAMSSEDFARLRGQAESFTSDEREILRPLKYDAM